MKRTQQLVERSLQTWPETRDSDRKLMLAVWYLQDNNYRDHFKQFFLHTAITPETITRMRRKLQEQGKYPASKAIEDQRYKKFVGMKNYGSYSPETIGEVI
jgi:hypothetical protein